MLLQLLHFPLWPVLQPSLHKEIDQSHTLLTASPFFLSNWLVSAAVAFAIQCHFPFTPKSFLQTLIRLESATIVKFKYLAKQTLFFLLWSLSIFGKNSDSSVWYGFLYWGSPLKLFYNFLPVRKRDLNILRQIKIQCILLVNYHLSLPCRSDYEMCVSSCLISWTYSTLRSWVTCCKYSFVLTGDMQGEKYTSLEILCSVFLYNFHPLASTTKNTVPQMTHSFKITFLSSCIHNYSPTCWINNLKFSIQANHRECLPQNLCQLILVCESSSQLLIVVDGYDEF